MNIKYYLKKINHIVKYRFIFGIQNLNKSNPLYKVGLSTAKHPMYMRKNASDVMTFHQVFYHRSYDIYNIKLKYEPKVIFDCGANIGMASVYFKNRYPGAKIISVEPESSNFDLLVKNTEKYDDIHCVKAGIWNRTTNLKITDRGLGNWGFITEEVDYEDNTTVKAVSIDELMKRYNVDFIDILKIDIETSEKELFEKNFEKWLPKVKILIIELHDNMKEGCIRSFFKAMVNYKFTMINLGENYVCELL